MSNLFRSQYGQHARVFANPGNPIKDVYSPRYDDRGVLDLTKTDEEDLYGYIQSHAESVDIHVLMQRFVNGEKDVLSRIQGFYADASDMPKTYAEVLNSVIAGEEAFSRLPVEVKQQFGNSFAVWLAAMDQPDFAERMGFAAPQDGSMTPSQAQDFVVPGTTPSSAPVAPVPSQASVDQPSS